MLDAKTSSETRQGKDRKDRCLGCSINSFRKIEQHMAETVVKFGTDGWRGIIADDFTYANVRVAASAIANYV